MAWISRNVDLGKALSISSWRKVAIGTWKSAGDPSVYGIIDVEMTPALNYIEKIKKQTGLKITVSHFVGKVVAQTFAHHPDINCILRFGRLYPRKTVDVFFQVASDTTGKDLSGTTIRNADKKTVAEIAKEMEEKVELIRKRGDPSFKKMKNTMGLIPGFLVHTVINLTGFLMYVLNIWSPLLGSPRDPFGSVMVTNIGSLGLNTAFAPLVPYSRVPLLLAIGAVKDAPIVKDGALAIGPVTRLCVTFDHRLIDGVHAAKMVKTLEKIFANPEQELGSAMNFNEAALMSKSR